RGRCYQPNRKKSYQENIVPDFCGKKFCLQHERRECFH
ncbi:unnamed protein product, partial [Tenebrio molitor]